MTGPWTAIPLYGAGEIARLAFDAEQQLEFFLARTRSSKVIREVNTYDHVIVGTGQATGTLLGRLIDTGDSIAVIEGHLVGGTCVNYGCTPTKTLVASARAIHLARRGNEFGFDADPVRVNYARVRERMNEIRHGSSDGLVHWMESTANVDLLRGWGRFETAEGAEGDGHLIKVDDEVTIRGRNIYLNVGTRAVAPAIQGLDDVPWLDSERLLDVEDLPEHLLVVGGGYVGLELTQIFRRFGSRVTLFQRGPEVMPREDADVSEVVRGVLEAEGVRMYCGAEALRAMRRGDGVSLEVRIGSEIESHDGSHLLVAAGRRPNSDRLNLGALGIETDERGFIEVDDLCRTSVAGIWAVGDVNGRGAFTHTSVNDAEIVLDQLFGGDRKISERFPIHALFTDPPLGRVGMTEKEALATGRRIGKATRAMARISRAKEMGETRGFAKLLVDMDSDRFLGATILGPGGDEIVNMFAAMMHGGMSWREFRRVVLVHPTIAELMPWTLDDLEEVPSRSLHKLDR